MEVSLRRGQPAGAWDEPDRVAPRLCAAAGRAWAVAAAAGAAARAPPFPFSEPPEAAPRPRLAPPPGLRWGSAAEGGWQRAFGAANKGGRQRAPARSPVGWGRQGRRAGPAALRFVSGAAGLRQPSRGVVAVPRPFPSCRGRSGNAGKPAW